MNRQDEVSQSKDESDAGGLRESTAAWCMLDSRPIGGRESCIRLRLSRKKQEAAHGVGSANLIVDRHASAKAESRLAAARSLSAGMRALSLTSSTVARCAVCDARPCTIQSEFITQRLAKSLSPHPTRFDTQTAWRVVKRAHLVRCSHSRASPRKRPPDRSLYST